MRRRWRSDLTGLVFNRWTVVSFDKTKGKINYWHCKCECGTKRSISGPSLYNKYGASKSCGCYKREAASKRAFKHGHTSINGERKVTREFIVWCGMRDRCLNPLNKRYENYGARGIKIIDRWANSFMEFFKDMGNCPNKMTLERIDNNGNYEPSNCKWATNKEQARNRRSNRKITIGDETLLLIEWAEKANLSMPTFWARLKAGWSIERALFTPCKRKTKNENLPNTTCNATNF
jgi:hypothetical protein